MDHDIWEGGSLNQKRPRPEIKGIFDDTESTLFESFAESSAGTALGYVIKGGGILLAAFILGLIICFANGFGSHLWHDSLTICMGGGGSCHTYTDFMIIGEDYYTHALTVVIDGQLREFHNVQWSLN